MRLPFFIWAQLVTSFLLLLAFPPLQAAAVMQLMIADRVWTTRAKNFTTSKDGLPLMQCPTIAHLGGATLDNEENYLIKKLFSGGLGIVSISNQARI